MMNADHQNSDGVKITMYYGDHGVPHFHVIAPDFKVSVAIASLDDSGRSSATTADSRGD